MSIEVRDRDGARKLHENFVVDAASFHEALRDPAVGSRVDLAESYAEVRIERAKE